MGINVVLISVSEDVWGTNRAILAGLNTLLLAGPFCTLCGLVLGTLGRRTRPGRIGQWVSFLLLIGMGATA